MVPNGWEVKKLQDIVSQDRKITYGIVVPGPFEEDGNLMIRAKDYSFGWQPIDSIYRVSDKIHQSYRRSQVRQGDILLTIVGSVGNTAVVPEYLDGANITQQTARLSFDKNIGDFFHLLLDSDIGKREIYRYVKSGVQPSLNLSDIAKFLLPVPPLPEQQKIAKILTTWDKAINTTKRLIDNSKQQKKALMQQLLTGRKRLLDNNGKPFEGEWLTKKLVDITTRVQRKSDGNDHPILTISSLSGFMTQKERYSRFMAGESLKKYVLLKNGEFAYNKGNSKTYQFGCIFKLEDFETGLVPNIYVCFRINNDLCEDFYKYLFEADYLKPQLGRLVNTGVRNDGLLNIKPNEFLNTTVPAPPLDEQQKIAAVLTNASREIELLEQQLADLQQEKKALMQQLLTGKKRVTL